MGGSGPKSMKRSIWINILITVLTCTVGCVSKIAQADEVIWLRKSTFDGKTALMLSADRKTLYCVGCNFNNYGPIPIQRGVGVNEFVPANIDPWMSTLWIILARVSQGNSCGTGEWYTI